MEQLEKFIAKLANEFAMRVRQAFLDIAALRLGHYDWSKMMGYKNLYKMRIGKIRILFTKAEQEGKPVYMEWRVNGYKKF